MAIKRTPSKYTIKAVSTARRLMHHIRLRSTGKLHSLLPRVVFSVHMTPRNTSPSPAQSSSFTPTHRRQHSISCTPTHMYPPTPVRSRVLYTIPEVPTPPDFSIETPERSLQADHGESTFTPRKRYLSMGRNRIRISSEGFRTDSVLRFPLETPSFASTISSSKMFRSRTRERSASATVQMSSTHASSVVREMLAQDGLAVDVILEADEDLDVGGDTRTKAEGWVPSWLLSSEGWKFAKEIMMVF